MTATASRGWSILGYRRRSFFFEFNVYVQLKGTPLPRNLYVTLPVKDIERGVDFFAALGFSFNPRSNDENAASLIINEYAGVGLLPESRFSTLTDKPVVDARAGTEALVAISVESRKAVDASVAKAVVAGGSAPVRHRIMASCTTTALRICTPAHGACSGSTNRRCHYR